MPGQTRMLLQRVILVFPIRIKDPRREMTAFHVVEVALQRFRDGTVCKLPPWNRCSREQSGVQTFCTRMNLRVEQCATIDYVHLAQRRQIDEAVEAIDPDARTGLFPALPQGTLLGRLVKLEEAGRQCP